jgi:hypothetical protein
MLVVDRKCIARPQQYEVAEFAITHHFSASDARAILKRAGAIREEAIELARIEKRQKRHRRQVRTIGLMSP